MKYTAFKPVIYLEQHLLNLERWHYAAASGLEPKGMCLAQVDKRTMEGLEAAITQTKKLLADERGAAMRFGPGLEHVY